MASDSGEECDGMKQAMINTMKKPKFDNIYTPEEAVFPLLNYFDYELERYKSVVWECCDAGNSAITKVLKNQGYKVISTDIETGFDFLKDTPDFHFDAIVTNPPYSKKTQFLKKCYEYEKPFALLLPITGLEGITRGELFQHYGLSVIVLNRRIEFTGEGGVWFNTSWFIGNDKLSGMCNRLYFENVPKKSPYMGGYVDKESLYLIGD